MQGGGGAGVSEGGLEGDVGGEEGWEGEGTREGGCDGEVLHEQGCCLWVWTCSTPLRIWTKALWTCSTMVDGSVCNTGSACPKRSVCLFGGSFCRNAVVMACRDGKACLLEESFLPGSGWIGLLGDWRVGWLGDWWA